MRERDVVRRLAVPRDAVPREVFAAPVARLAADAAPAFFAAEVRAEPVPALLARVEVLRVVEALRVPVERVAALFLPPLVALRAEPREDVEPEPALASPSKDHLPDMTRWAASATASAINEPSFVALETTLLAAWEAVSAASSPASRILRRAAGLALIAAAAAARPAASISLLIAAFASLSTVSLVDVFEELVFVDLAIALSPSRAVKIALPP